MSAWIVSKRHIDALVTGLIRAEVAHPTEYATEDGLGRLLWRENHRSVNARYGESTDTPEYEFEPLTISPVSLLKQVGCYQYQSCEHAAWDTSLACQLTTALAEQLHRAGITHTSPGYDDAPWGID